MALSTLSLSADCGDGRVIYPVTPNGVEHNLPLDQDTKKLGDLSGNA